MSSLPFPAPVNPEGRRTLGRKRKDSAIRLAFALPLLALAGCSVDNDSANDQVSVQYNQQRIEMAARTARDVGSAAGNVAATTGRAIRNEVGDVDVDVDIRRNRASGAGNEAEAR